VTRAGAVGAREPEGRPGAREGSTLLGPLADRQNSFSLYRPGNPPNLERDPNKSELALEWEQTDRVVRSYEAEPQETKPAASVSVKLARGGLSVNGEGRLGGRLWGDARATPYTSHTNSAVAINGIILTSGESSEGSKLTKPDSERNASSTTRQTRLVVAATPVWNATTTLV